jgi:NADPH-dependent 7-cyano-7-deazaguanine reductase QueF
MYIWSFRDEGAFHEAVTNQNIDNSECFGVTFVKIYPEMTSQ